MDVDAWLEEACRGAERRELPELARMLTVVAEGIRRLRTADWEPDAGGPGDPAAPTS